MSHSADDLAAMAAAAFTPHHALAIRLLPHALGGGDGAHDVAHLLRVWKNARAIQAAEGGDGELLAAAVLLHDAVTVEKNSPQRAQASRLAADAARDRLAAEGWPQERIAAVAHAIVAHSFSAGVAPQTLEARILQDADRLDAIGAVGVARRFYVAGRLGSLLYDPFDSEGEARPLDDRRFALDHFKTKLMHLASGFQTATGATLARERHERLLRFWREMRDEI
ncbi:MULTISPECIES: HD domain-containing protein [unclassified Bradyrhizobium]|uniref:HD domain-containing protein n=1 Tax=unclassified Bradyrhizobium TaxID=2631580 RepID=UPI0020137236|nr:MULTISPECIES: HD domain-containing protein [unclassified Bradyrhizobium]